MRCERKSRGGETRTIEEGVERERREERKGASAGRRGRSNRGEQRKKRGRRNRRKKQEQREREVLASRVQRKRLYLYDYRVSNSL